MGIIRLIFVCAVVFLSAGISTAQVTNLTVQEFDKRMDTAFGTVNTKIRRITVKVTIFEQGRETRTDVSVYEYLPPDRFRSHLISSSESSSSEYIEADEKCYLRVKGIWDYASCGGSDIPPYLFWRVMTDGPGAEIKTSQVREENLNGRSVKRYSRKFRQNFETARGHPPTPPVDGFEEVWIGANGLVLKAESVYHDGNNKEPLQKWILDYEYDPKDLRIDAPIK